MDEPDFKGSPQAPTQTIWWSNSIFFVASHVAAVVGAYYRPVYALPQATLVLACIAWHSSMFGITIGYHRLYSHRAFRASFCAKAVLTALGTAGFQGSIKWWCLRHRLHHRFTDDPVHDPYAATRGLLWSHMGWIFYKSTYERMELVDREDLESDPIVRFQHRHYVPLALFFGLVLPTLIGRLWADALGAFVWAGLFARVATWHCTFLVNSLAHWDGLQPYSDEDTSRGSLLLALLTCGEGSHNFHHAFPHDFRSGPSLFFWDPSKWIILALHRLGFVTGLRRAREEDINEATAFMSHKTQDDIAHNYETDEKDWKGEVWGIDSVENYINAKPGRCVILLNGMIVDATAYLGDHPGGAALLRKYSIRLENKGELWRDATWAFDGGLNQHSRAARRVMSELRVAKFVQE